MSIKLSILKSGEYIISDLYQADDERGKLIGYVLKDPKLIVATSKYEENSTEIKTDVALLTWPSFTMDKQVEALPDSFVTHVNPSNELKTLYEESLK